MSDFRLECVWESSRYKYLEYYIGGGHNSTYNTGTPFNHKKDKNVADYISIGVRLDLKRVF